MISSLLGEQQSKHSSKTKTPPSKVQETFEVEAMFALFLEFALQSSVFLVI